MVVVVTTTVATRPRTAAAEATMVATTRTRTAVAAAATTVAVAQMVADTVSATETPPRHHDVDNYHTSATCSRPGEYHQRTATHTNTRGGSMHGMHKTILPSAAGRQAPTPRPPPPPINYTPTYFQAWNNGPCLPMTPGSWGFGPHAAAYQRANNVPPPQRGTAMMHNTMASGDHTYQQGPPPMQGPQQAPPNQEWYNNF